jgi:hypothetical protein
LERSTCWVEKFTERILDLGGDVKFEGMKSRDLIGDPVEYVKADLAIQEPGVELLMKCMEGSGPPFFAVGFALMMLLEVVMG